MFNRNDLVFVIDSNPFFGKIGRIHSQAHWSSDYYNVFLNDQSTTRSFHKSLLRAVPVDDEGNVIVPRPHTAKVESVTITFNRPQLKEVVARSQLLNQAAAVWDGEISYNYEGDSGE